MTKYAVTVGPSDYHDEQSRLRLVRRDRQCARGGRVTEQPFAKYRSTPCGECGEPITLSDRDGLIHDKDGLHTCHAPKRSLTPTQRLHEVTLAALNRTPRAAAESVTISRNAKGDVQLEVVAQSQDGETLSDVAARAQSVFADLHSSFELSRTQTYERNTEPPARIGKPK